MDDTSREVEIYGELGLLPKLGLAVRFTRQSRLEHVIDAAAEHAELSREELEERLVGSTDRVRDVVARAALRAGEFGDDDYLDALGRLIAGALDSAVIDELAFVTAEVTKMEPVHLRALLGFFSFGRNGNEAADPDLGADSADWAHSRSRSDREIARLLALTRESAGQVLRQLDRDGFLHIQEAGSDTTRSPTDWSARVISFLFPTMTVEVRADAGGVRVQSVDSTANEASTASAPLAEGQLVPVAEHDPDIRTNRLISELEAEIKTMERKRLSHVRGLDLVGGDLPWLSLLKQRLRRIDPNNPWAYDD